MEDPSRLILLYAILPLWLVAGFADWLCHRHAHIETTTGAKESSSTLLMFAEVGLPLLAGIFLEVNALVLGLMVVCFFLPSSCTKPQPSGMCPMRSRPGTSRPSNSMCTASWK